MTDAPKRILHPRSGEEMLTEVYADPGSNGWYYREKMPDSAARFIRADLATPTVAEAAKSWLADYDGFMAGKGVSPESGERIISLTTAATFAAAAYERGAGGNECHALLLSFLMALVDPKQEALDYLRADLADGQTARDADSALRALAQGGEWWSE